MGLPPVDARASLFGGVVVVVPAFLPIATCPNGDGRGSVSPQVNERRIRAHPLMTGKGESRQGNLRPV